MVPRQRRKWVVSAEVDHQRREHERNWYDKEPTAANLASQRAQNHLSGTCSSSLKPTQTPCCHTSHLSHCTMRPLSLRLPQMHRVSPSSSSDSESISMVRKDFSLLILKKTGPEFRKSVGPLYQNKISIDLIEMIFFFERIRISIR